MEPGDGGPQAERSRRLAAQTVRVFPPMPYTPPAPPTSVATTVGTQLDPQESRTATSTSSAKISLLPMAQCAPSAACHIQIAQLQDEKSFLAKYAERLLTQLRHVLHKHGELDKLKSLGEPSTIDTEENNEREERLPPWMIAKEVVHPLLQSYDIKIYELESAVSESKLAMDRMARHVEGLAQSNTSLRQELEAAAEKAVLRTQHEPKAASVMGVRDSGFDDLMHDSGAGGGDYLGDLSERIDVLMSENSLLMEQVSLQDDELSGLKKEISDRDQQLTVMGQNFNEATMALQELRDACATIGDEKTRCEQQLQQYAARMAQLEGEKEAVVRHAEKLKSEGKTFETQFSEYEQLLENVKKNAERKDESFAARYQNVCTRLRELNSIVEDRDRRLETMEEQLRNATTELESVRQDCEGMLQVMNLMEKQLTQYCAREDAVAELEQECKTKVEEMILEKEQMSAREVQARREIARLLERTRTLTEEHLKSQEESTGQLTRRYDQELNNRETELRDLSNELTQLRVKLDISARNQRDAEKSVADAMRRTKEATEMYERKLKALVERAAAAEEAKDMASRIENEAMLGLRAKEEDLAKMRNDFRDRTQELNERITSLERELEIRRNEARELREENEEKNRKTQLLNEQLNKVKADCAGRFSADFEAIHKENRDLKARAADAEYRLTIAKKDLASALETARNERERSEVRLIAEVETLKARVATLKEEKTRVDKLRQEAESRQAVLTLQIQQAMHDLTDTKEALVEREHACDDSDRKISELSAQLTVALSKQQQFFRQERELRASIERLTLEKTRLERDSTNCRKKLEEFRHADFLSLTQLGHGRADSSSAFSKPERRRDRAASNQSTRGEDAHHQSTR